MVRNWPQNVVHRFRPPMPCVAFIQKLGIWTQGLGIRPAQPVIATLSSKHPCCVPLLLSLPYLPAASLQSSQIYKHCDRADRFMDKFKNSSPTRLIDLQELNKARTVSCLNPRRHCLMTRPLGSTPSPRPEC